MDKMWLVVVRFYDVEEGEYAGVDEYAAFPDQAAAREFIKQQEDKYKDAPLVGGARYACDCEIVHIPVNPKALY